MFLRSNALIIFCYAVLMASCQTNGNGRNEHLDVPSEVVGEIDEFWEIHLSGLSGCTTEDICELYRRAAEDAYLGTAFSRARAQTDKIDSVLGVSIEEFVQHSDAVRIENSDWLRRRISRVGWFDVSSSGQFADEMAFLIVQHSDHNVEFQIEVLELLEELDANQNTSPANIAYLTDRIAVSQGQMQVYGTQGSCVDSGEWSPSDIVNSSDVDERRTQRGLGPLAAYIESNSAGCG